MTKTKNDVMILENTGQKNSIGSNFKQLRNIQTSKTAKKFGVCLDTCHAFVYGWFENRAESKKLLQIWQICRNR